MSASGRTATKLLFFLFFFGVLLPGGWYLFTRLEGDPPEVQVSPDVTALGNAQELTVTVSDPGRGVRKLRVVLSAGGQDRTLYEANFEGSVLKGTGRQKEAAARFSVEPKALGLADGDGRLRIEATDYSWRRWWNGNLAEIDRTVRIDTQAPRVSVLTTSHYINQGGSGLVAFRVSEPCETVGVTVGDHFYPAATGFFETADVYAGFFAVGYDQATTTPVAVTARDAAGNLTTATFPYRIRPKKFRTDVLTITDGFVETNLAGVFSPDGGETLSNKDLFLHVNRKVREDNYNALTDVGRRSESRRYWEGPFLRLPKSAPRAQFADHRIYRYDGNEIDRQVHLGADLASISQSPVPAANTGKVVFTGDVGIYGNTVIVDHGFGLLSSYSHLSAISVAVGDEVAQGDIVGRTGATGLAAGDHLHFGVLIHDTFVNPVEWWDEGWIRDNIELKIQQVEARSAS